MKGLDLISRVSDELWNEVRDIVQETGIKTVLRGLTNSCDKRRSKKQRRKGKI